MPINDAMRTAAFRAVADTCSLARTLQRQLGSLAKMSKEDYSPVTVADYAVQALVALSLQRELGTLVLVGEESSADLHGPQAEALRSAVTSAVRSIHPTMSGEEIVAAIDLGNHDASGSAYWTLDPIDGTKGFLRGGQFAISLGYIDNGLVQLGVLGCPNLSPDFTQPFDRQAEDGTLYFAERARGAFGASLSDVRAGHALKPIAVAAGRALTTMRVCESVEAGHSRLDDTQRIVAHLRATGRPARLDSQCKYAVVARGQADAYIRLPTRADYQEKIWDHAAGALLAAEAGATVTDIDGKPLDFSQGTTLKRNRGVVCAPAPFHEGILHAIRALK